VLCQRLRRSQRTTLAVFHDGSTHRIQTLFAAQRSDRLSALVYFDGASDPTITGADVNPPMPDLNTLPRLARSPAIDRSSFAAFRLSR
jgi:hypothetical protein